MTGSENRAAIAPATSACAVAVMILLYDKMVDVAKRVAFIMQRIHLTKKRSGAGCFEKPVISQTLDKGK